MDHEFDEALADSENQIFFDASSTLHRARFVEQAARAGKAVYCEKPTAVTTEEALRLAQICEDFGVKMEWFRTSSGCRVSGN